jgi:hypothetical protein
MVKSLLRTPPRRDPRLPAPFVIVRRLSSATTEDIRSHLSHGGQKVLHKWLAREQNIHGKQAALGPRHPSMLTLGTDPYKALSPGSRATLANATGDEVSTWSWTRSAGCARASRRRPSLSRRASSAVRR